MSDGGDCRTAPATPGLLIIKESINDKADCKTAPATPSLLIKCAVMFSAFSNLQCAVTQRLPLIGQKSDMKRNVLEHLTGLFQCKTEKKACHYQYQCSDQSGIFTKPSFKTQLDNNGVELSG